MGRRALTDTQRARLLESFRTELEPGTPASFSRAAEAAEVDRRTARRAWGKGWPGVRPIREMIEGERTMARATLTREALSRRLEDASKLAQEDAAESRALAGKQVQLVNRAATNALVALHSEQVFLWQRRLAAMMQHEDPSDPKAVAARVAFLDMAKTIRHLAAAARLGQESERLVLGEPSVILGGTIGVRPVVAANATPEEIAAEIEAAQRAVEEMREIEGARGEEGADADAGDGTLPQ